MMDEQMLARHRAEVRRCVAIMAARFSAEDPHERADLLCALSFDVDNPADTMAHTAADLVCQVVDRAGIAELHRIIGEWILDYEAGNV